MEKNNEPKLFDLLLGLTPAHKANMAILDVLLECLVDLGISRDIIAARLHGAAEGTDEQTAGIIREFASTFARTDTEMN